ncbi:MAG: carbon storage regulator [Acidobacteria bacterium]|nr:carbon storage regulator [Acidobacteriota bacterium]
MLVIRRRAGESIEIGGSIVIRVLDTAASRVTLGIIAPQEVPVLRSEIRDQNEAAARGVTPAAIDDLVRRLRGGK